MPTVIRSGPYRFFFYAGDRDESPHVHVERDDIDEDISVEGLIAGQPSGESQSSFKKWLQDHM